MEFGCQIAMKRLEGCGNYGHGHGNYARGWVVSSKEMEWGQTVEIVEEEYV